MRASRLLFVAAALCFAAVAVAADEGDGQVIDGCYFYQGQQVGCLKVNIFTCDNLWDFQLTRSVGDAQLIINSGMNRFGPDTIYSCFADVSCTECILFEDIRLEGNAMTMTVTYSRQCDGDIIHASFGTFLAKGAACGSSGYFYVPCTRRGLSEEKVAELEAQEEVAPTEARQAPDTEEVLSLGDEAISVNALISESLSRDADDFWFLGTDGCVYIVIPTGYPNAGDYVLLTCPVAAMDTCSSDTDLVTSAGVLYHFPIFEDMETSQCVGISADVDACLFVTNAFYDDNSVFATLRMSLNVYGGEIATLQMGVFFWEFPHCGDSLEDCALIPTFSESGFIDSILFPSSPLDTDWHYSFSYYFSFSSGSPVSPIHYHHHHSPNSPNGSPSHESDGADQTGIWVGVMVGSVVLFVCAALIAACVVGLGVIKKREERGENLYNLFAGGDDQAESVVEAAGPDSEELLTH